MRRERATRAPSDGAARTHSRRMQGYSVLELVLVFVIIIIMAGFTALAIRPSRNAYLPDTSASIVLGYLREASSRALAERRTIRVEIDTRDQTPKIRLVDQNTLTPPAAEYVVREEALPGLEDVNMAIPTPGGTAMSPPAAPYNFVGANIPSNTLWSVRFSSFGSACDENLLPLSATLFFFIPTAAGGTIPTTDAGVRAITISGPGGSMRFWKYRPGSGFVSNSR
jgi:hypothetical protein